MIETAKNCEKTMIATSIALLILGIVLVIAPITSIQFITIGISIVFMLIGVVQIVNYIRCSRAEKMTSLSLVLGVILLAIGVYLISNNTKLGELITGIIGFFILIKSLFKIQYAVNLKGISNKWKYNLIAGLLYMTLGIIVIMNPLDSLETFLRIIGVILIIGSVAELFETLKVLKTLDDVDYKELEFIEKDTKKKNKEPMEFIENKD